MNKNLPERILKKVLHKIYKPVLENYLRKERTYRYEDLVLRISPGVFHPGFFFSTKILISFLKRYDLRNKTFLELGAGSGLIAIHAAKQGAVVTATDISKKALENISANKKLNHVSLEEIHSDAFDNIPEQVFDFVVINPPYYRGKIKHESDYAWYAGEQLDYFQKLFQQLPAFIDANSKVFMILSDACDVDHIKSLAIKNNLVFEMIFSKKIFWETNTIFEIRL